MRNCDPARIFNRIQKAASGCWLYTGGISSSGYGIVSIKNRSVHVHRLAYSLKCGPIPEATCVLHRCDIRRCINPDHLFLGSLADNNRDCMDKGRTADRRGEKNTGAKFTPKRVARVRRAYGTGRFSQRTVGEMFGISQQQVSSIVRGQAWPHLKTSGAEALAR
jgi:hypothetical protein